MFVSLIKITPQFYQNEQTDVSLISLTLLKLLKYLSVLIRTINCLHYIKRRVIKFYIWWKIRLALSVFYFQLKGVWSKSYRQVLTLADNLQHLLRLPIYDKTRLGAFHLQYDKGNYNNFFSPERVKSESVYGLDSLLAVPNNDHCQVLATNWRS